MIPETNDLSYYTQQSWVTDPGEFADLFEGLPTEIEALRKVCQNIFVHKWVLKYMGKSAYGVDFSDFEGAGRVSADEYNQVAVRETLGFLQEIGDAPLTSSRPPLSRVIGNCRHYAVMLTSILRHQGVPARARSGCAGYLEPRDPAFFVDHYVTEYWNQDEERWILVDAQLDEGQIGAFGIEFDPCDVPRDEFVVAGEIWTRYRAGEVNPDKYGIEGIVGPDYIKFKVVNDVAFLNKEEVLPWDGWGLGKKPLDELDESELNLLETLASLAILPSNEEFKEIREIYQRDNRVKKPEHYQSVRWEMPR
ncbi:transglutaminase domain-containing protein [Candidatus Thorarchaeota archaeon]|nr:MAG: transglutaminase domain-containing protein [Candidatus Thorarchaeota archaeon]